MCDWSLRPATQFSWVSRPNCPSLINQVLKIQIRLIHYKDDFDHKQYSSGSMLTTHLYSHSSIIQLTQDLQDTSPLSSKAESYIYQGEGKQTKNSGGIRSVPELAQGH